MIHDQRALEAAHQSFAEAARFGVIHLATEDQRLDGREITAGGRKMLNFGSCSYLGLESDERLRAGAIDAIRRYGTQFSSSRAYMSLGLYTEAEALLEQVFGSPVIVTPSTSLGHLSSVPVLVGEEDAVILDHQVHNSVNTAVQMLVARKVPIKTVRHNDYERLDRMVARYAATHRRVWYMVDGVFSMFGDFASLRYLEKLLGEHEKLHLYVDDAHGMSWAGLNGSGYTLSRIQPHPRLFLATSLNKSFAAGGGVLVFPEPDSRDLVRSCGGTMIFSGPLQPAQLGALLASAKIHLSPEIHALQNELAKRTEWFVELAKQLGLPLVSDSYSPIFFIGAGQPEVGFAAVKRLMECGFYTNISAFPAVPKHKTGLRITLNNHLTFDDIERLLTTLSAELVPILEQHATSLEAIHETFAEDRGATYQFKRATA